MEVIFTWKSKIFSNIITIFSDIDEVVGTMAYNSFSKTSI